MAQPTELQQLIFHLDQASTIAFSLQKETELGVDMGKLYQRLDDYVNTLMFENEVEIK
jgi:hypothetical protein